MLPKEACPNNVLNEDKSSNGASSSVPQVSDDGSISPPTSIIDPGRAGGYCHPLQKVNVPTTTQTHVQPPTYHDLGGMLKAISVPQARPNFFNCAQQPMLFRPIHLSTEPAPPMPLSILPKKKRKKKKKEQRYTDLQGQYLATSWYFNESSFPVTLMAMIESPQSDSPCISFLSDNQRFVIVDPSRLEQEIFPKHFDLRTPTLDEFSEMLHLWGFEKSVDKLFPNVAVYKHEQFRKGEWEKCLKIEMPLESLEKLSKIQGRPSKGSGSNFKSSKQNTRKRPRRGNIGVPLPPAELVAGFTAGSVESPRLDPSAASVPRRITEEKAHGNATLQSLLLSQLGQTNLQSIMLGQSHHHQQQMPLLSRRITVDSNSVTQKFHYPRPSTSIMSKADYSATAKIHNGTTSDDPGSIKGKLNSTQLDVMTEQFLAQSNARLKSRPAGINGPTSDCKASRSPSLPIECTKSEFQSDEVQFRTQLAAPQRFGSTRRITMI